jgi:hypothetical protein
MTPVNIKQEVAALEQAGVKYETKVTPFYEESKLTHKHIFIPALDKSYIRTNDLQWHEGECDIC